MVFNEQLDMSALPRLMTAEKFKKDLANGNGRSQKISQKTPPDPDSTTNYSDDLSTTPRISNSTKPPTGPKRSQSTAATPSIAIESKTINNNFIKFI